MKLNEIVRRQSEIKRMSVVEEANRKSALLRQVEEVKGGECQNLKS